MRQLQMCAPLKRSPASVLPHPSHGASEKYGSYSLPSSGMSSTNPITPLIPSPHSSIISPTCASVPSPFAITCTQSGQNSRLSTLTVAIVLSSSHIPVCLNQVSDCPLAHIDGQVEHAVPQDDESQAFEVVPHRLCLSVDFSEMVTGIVVIANAGNLLFPHVVVIQRFRSPRSTHRL